MSSCLELAREGRVARIALNRPEKRNALNLDLCRELADAIEAADADRETGAILLAANGPSFCAGMDLEEALAADRGALEQTHERIFTVGARLSTPIVAAVQGAALAGGTGLVANCHVVLAADGARFGLTEVRIGMWPFVILRAVAAAAGERRTMEWGITGRIFGPEEARQSGLVHRVVPPADLAREAAATAAEIAGYSPAVLHAGLSYMSAIRDRGWRDSGELARIAREELFRSLDFEEGIRAFREKRAPEWPSLRR